MMIIQAPKVIYGLRAKTVATYRVCMAYGLPHDKAMAKLKALYDHSKEIAETPLDWYDCIHTGTQ